mgnify:CR=1 FL=1
MQCTAYRSATLQKGLCSRHDAFVWEGAVIWGDAAKYSGAEILMNIAVVLSGGTGKASFSSATSRVSSSTLLRGRKILLRERKGIS